MAGYGNPYGNYGQQLTTNAFQLNAWQVYILV